MVNIAKPPTLKCHQRLYQQAYRKVSIIVPLHPLSSTCQSFSLFHPLFLMPTSNYLLSPFLLNFLNYPKTHACTNSRRERKTVLKPKEKRWVQAMWRGRRWTRRQRCRRRGRTRRGCSTSGANCRFAPRGWPLADLQSCWHLVTSPCTPRKSPKPPPSTWPEWLPEFLLPLNIRTLASRWSNPSILFTYILHGCSLNVLLF